MPIEYHSCNPYSADDIVGRNRPVYGAAARPIVSKIRLPGDWSVRYTKYAVTLARAIYCSCGPNNLRVTRRENACDNDRAFSFLINYHRSCLLSNGDTYCMTTGATWYRWDRKSYASKAPFVLIWMSRDWIGFRAVKLHCIVCHVSILICRNRILLINWIIGTKYMLLSEIIYFIYTTRKKCDWQIR